ncbi:MAG: hypothetical protein JM58_19290 [Peptococcaceae bacterium BICA1-8]|nr:MAG: hypothetical protein JM58_19290 [Peptococcaceae bacterium BICA1-8]
MVQITIYTATGCTRCKIVKRFMEERGITYAERDMKAEGKEEFQSFYKANRSGIFRGPDGIEFPIITDGENIRQSIGASIAFLHSGTKLNGFFSVGTLHKEWVDGIHVSGGNPDNTEEYLAVLRYLKGNNLKLQIDTNGKNSLILQQVLRENLADMLIVNILGPQQLYSKLSEKEIDIDDVKASLGIVANFPKSKIETVIVPVIREDGTISFLTPEEIGETAKLIEEGTGSKKNHYLLKMFNPKEAQESKFRLLDPLPNKLVFAYRTKARTYQVFTEIENI